MVGKSWKFFFFQISVEGFIKVIEYRKIGYEWMRHDQQINFGLLLENYRCVVVGKLTPATCRYNYLNKKQTRIDRQTRGHTGLILIIRYSLNCYTNATKRIFLGSKYRIEQFIHCFATATRFLCIYSKC